MRIVGLDVSRSVAEIAYLEDGTLHASGRTGLRRDELERFAVKLRATDHVVLEATGNTTAIVSVLRPHVARVVIANPLQVRLIAEARVKTDKIDAAVLAQLYASGFLPEVWMPDERTLALRRQISYQFTTGLTTHTTEERDSRSPDCTPNRAMSRHRSVWQEGACVARCSTAATG